MTFMHPLKVRCKSCKIKNEISYGMCIYLSHILVFGLPRSNQNLNSTGMVEYIFINCNGCKK